VDVLTHQKAGSFTGTEPMYFSQKRLYYKRFPIGYLFPADIPRASIALMIGNALPPAFCRQQAKQYIDPLGRCFYERYF
jgi:hypothetical protein